MAQHKSFSLGLTSSAFDRCVLLSVVPSVRIVRTRWLDGVVDRTKQISWRNTEERFVASKNILFHSILREEELQQDVSEADGLGTTSIETRRAVPTYTTKHVAKPQDRNETNGEHRSHRPYTLRNSSVRRTVRSSAMSRAKAS